MNNPAIEIARILLEHEIEMQAKKLQQYQTALAAGDTAKAEQARQEYLARFPATFAKAMESRLEIKASEVTPIH